MPDPNLTAVTMFEDDRGLAREPDAGGCTRENDRPRFERGALGEEGDGLTHTKDLVSGRKEVNVVRKWRHDAHTWCCCPGVFCR